MQGAQSSDKKRDFGVSKIINTAQTRMELSPLMKKEASTFQKSETHPKNARGSILY
jgi:hypothetical protein